MEQIATQLGVSQRQISTDLEGLEVASKPSRPKGGRPKGNGKARKPRDEKRTVEDQAAARMVLDEGKTIEQAASATGLNSVQKVKTAIAREEGRREAEPTVTPDLLSMSAQEKLNAAIRQHQRKLDLQFEQCVRDELNKRLEETVLPHFRQKQAEAKKVMDARRGVMDKAKFNSIRRALHPDSRNSISDKMLAEAFDAFMGLEKVLLSEKNSPTESVGIPTTMAEWDAMKRKADAARKSKRSASKSTIQTRH